MTPNNLTLEEARKLLDDWYESKDSKKNRDSLGMNTIDYLIISARMLQKEEDAEIVFNYIFYRQGHISIEELQKLKAQILNPEAPLSDNHEK